MATPPNGEQLETTRYVTAVLRLALDDDGRLLSGEVADVEHRTSQRFVDTEGALAAVARWLGAYVRER